MRHLLLLCLALLAIAPAAAQRKSGTEYMGESTRAMQRDDSQNPAMLWVGDGAALWHAKVGAEQKSCASCHGDAKSSMRGVAARLPAFDNGSMAVLNLGGKIAQCRAQRQLAAAFKPESRELLALESYIALQSRGMTLNPPDQQPLAAAAARGQQRYFQRIGQLNLSCAQCHDDNAGKRLAGALIPQGHATAYPIYRLEWQDMGSLQRRLRNCMNGVRAEMPPYGAQELVELEAYLAARAKGMAMESPGVRP